jgi:hypothetical protein
MREMPTAFWGGNLRVEHLWVGGTIILKWICKKWGEYLKGLV